MITFSRRILSKKGLFSVAVLMTISFFINYSYFDGVLNEMLIAIMSSIFFNVLAIIVIFATNIKLSDKPETVLFNVIVLMSSISAGATLTAIAYFIVYYNQSYIQYSSIWLMIISMALSMVFSLEAFSKTPLKLKSH